MKKFLSTVLVLLAFAQNVLAFSVDTSEWVCAEPGQVAVVAAEIDLKSDLKNDYRVYQASIENKTNSTLDISIPSNSNIDENVKKILNGGLSFKELMQLPKQIAVESYKEDVGEGKIAAAHKGLIYLTASAGAVAAGAGLLGVYPQQKTEEYFAHKRIKKEYKRFQGNLISDFTMAPLSQKDLLIFVPVDNSACIINVKNRDDDNDVYSDYHQL